MIKFTALPFKIDQVFLTSDTHYGHKNICSGTSEWEPPQNEGCRKFDTMEEMNDAIVDGINRQVKKTDLLIHCGDWSFGGEPKIAEFRYRINCEHIMLLQGNHDHKITQNQVYEGLFTEFTQIGFYSIQGLRFVCAHYPMSIWHQSHHDVPLFYGHVHGSFNNVGKSLDVGMDNIYKRTGKYEPIRLDEANSIAMSRDTYLESHHNRFTS
ncbi:metallophosphoesterase family protein [Dyadobacter sp. LJ53]|uniref:metallophosphoesterase n=1 Tax=Dyadobacter chenwenxiniae TaxID=2906456 RepID=UPI001F22885A|nr:metallophosphoesterase [Dyadobacter chenwenxiniae]MCF0049235.1 metallophosphoesterase family protein [Dyadobacter chenwenxiniae]